MRKFPRALPGILALAFGSSLGATETWLLPERFAATPGARLTLALTGGDAFPAAEAAPGPERFARALGRVGGVAVIFAPPRPAENALAIDATLLRPGVAPLGVELKPRLLEFTDETIEPYFRSLHAGEDLRAAWAARPAPRRWRELCTRHAKSFVRVGEPGPDDRRWSEPLGFTVEILPQQDPTALRVGDELAIVVLRGGAPAAGLVVTFASAGGAREHVRATDPQGRASAVLDRAGLWLVHGSDLRRVAAADHEWESDFSTLLLELKSPTKD